ncbi:MAG: ABC transporter ATP-binding protein [Verrucomicrobiales bacterium]
MAESTPQHLLRMIDVHKALGEQKILQGVNLDIYAGETLVIIGRSGEGKSVLLKNMVGLMKPDQGRILYEDQDIAQLSERQLMPIRRRIGILFQGGALFDSFTVKENIAFPLWEAGERNRRVIAKKVDEALEVVNLAGHGDKMPVNLSGGMKKRVGLARAIIGEPSCVLYDEPTAGLDPVVTDSIDQLILRLQSRFGITSVVVTHDMKSAFHVANRIAYLREGKIYFLGTPEELKNNEDPAIQDFIEGRSSEEEQASKNV